MNNILENLNAEKPAERVYALQVLDVWLVKAGSLYSLYKNDSIDNCMAKSLFESDDLLSVTQRLQYINDILLDTWSQPSRAVKQMVACVYKHFVDILIKVLPPLLSDRKNTKSKEVLPQALPLWTKVVRSAESQCAAFFVCAC